MKDIFINNLKNYELWTEKSKISVHEINKRFYSINFLANSETISRIHSTHFDVNIIDDLFYLLSIQITKENRGKGLGLKLYNILEKIAKELNCNKIVQTPSGWTKTGESRESYLMRKGWTLENNIAYKNLK